MLWVRLLSWFGRWRDWGIQSKQLSKVPYVICDRSWCWPHVVLMPAPHSYPPSPRSLSLQPSVLPMRRATVTDRKGARSDLTGAITTQSTRQLINIGGTLPPTFSAEPHNTGTDVLLQSWPSSMVPGAHDPKARVSNWPEHKTSPKKEPQSGQRPPVHSKVISCLVTLTHYVPDHPRLSVLS